MIVSILNTKGKRIMTAILNALQGNKVHTSPSGNCPSVDPSGKWEALKVLTTFSNKTASEMVKPVFI